MNDDDRPDPESLLSAIKHQESKNTGGRLKIFFGMSAGVGKTYAMLEAAQERLKEGEDVVVGTINTHGRKETAAILEGLPIIPEKWIKYKDTIFEELDIDQILAKKPQLVLIDELAHTNVPGSRHPKRWQDVLEILGEGIDVYTTLNVQHIESRKELVEKITGITIRETVPDSILERAMQIELVDLPPNELLKRLREGKVYLGDQSEIAARNFFKEDRLTALREIALRLTAEKVDHDLHGMLTTQDIITGWTGTERLMVCVSHSPHSQNLIRTARRLAYTLDAHWIALHVDDGSTLSSADDAILAKNLSLARELGAEVITTADTDVARAVQRIAKQKNITQIIIGRPPKWSWKSLFFQGSLLLDRLAREASDIDVHVIRQQIIFGGEPFSRNQWWFFNFSTKPAAYIWTLLFILTLTFFSSFAEPYIGYKSVGFIFLIGLLILSLFTGRGAILFGATLSALIWKFMYIPPIGSFEMKYTEDIALFIVYFLAAIITGIFTSRIRERELLLEKREGRSQAIYEIVQEIASAPSTEDLFTAINERLGKLLKGRCCIIVKPLEGEINLEDQCIHSEKERAVAGWVLDHGKEAGWATDTLPSVGCLFLPLKGFKEIVGIIGFRPHEEHPPLSTEEMTILYTIAQQLGAYLERSLAEERARKTEYMQQIEKVQQAILSSISSQFHKPLSSIRGAANVLKEEISDENKETKERSIQQIEDSSDNINRIVENSLAMTKIYSGFLALNKKEHEIPQLIKACIENLKKSISQHVIIIRIAKNLPLIPFDFSLMELVLCNLIMNAVENSPEGTQVIIEAQIQDNQCSISVSDEGPGIPPEALHLVYEKFYRIPGTEGQGIGLGLAICKAIVELHKGQIYVRNLDKGGIIVSILLPVHTENNGA